MKFIYLLKFRVSILFKKREIKVLFYLRPDYVMSG